MTEKTESLGWKGQRVPFDWEKPAEPTATLKPEALGNATGEPETTGKAEVPPILIEPGVLPTAIEPVPPPEQNLLAEGAPVPPETVAPIPAPTPTTSAGEIGSKEDDKKSGKIKKAVRRHPVRTIAGVVGAGLLTAAIIFAARSGDSSPTVGPERTPTPSAAAGTPSPTETPKPLEVVKTPNFGVRYDPIKKNCAVVDRDTGKEVDNSNASSIERISYQETGVGVVKDISITLQPGQTAIIQGWKVDGQGNGVFKAITATEQTTKFSVKIADGAIEIVDSKNGPLVFCRAVQIAVAKGHAHEKVEIPEAWNVTQ